MIPAHSAEYESPNADAVRAAYGLRAQEYWAAVGRIEETHPADRELIASWAANLQGPVVDAGCGPGHWTAFLRDQGVEVEGVDLVPEFIELASGLFPDGRFTVGTLGNLKAGDGSLGGILAWYSLIHLHPSEMPAVLAEFARCLRPGGCLLLGVFAGTSIERFDHAVVPAYYWPADELTLRLAAAGFETYAPHLRTEAGRRPHAALAARRL